MALAGAGEAVGVGLSVEVGRSGARLWAMDAGSRQASRVRAAEEWAWAAVISLQLRQPIFLPLKGPAREEMVRP